MKFLSIARRVVTCALIQVFCSIVFSDPLVVAQAHTRTPFFAMPKVEVTIHKNGLHPIEAIKPFYKSTENHMSIDEIIDEGEVVNLSGGPPGRKAMWNAIRRVGSMGSSDLLPKTKYEDCGRKKILTEKQERDIIEFVEKVEA